MPGILAMSVWAASNSVWQDGSCQYVRESLWCEGAHGAGMDTAIGVQPFYLLY